LLIQRVLSWEALLLLSECKLILLSDVSHRGRLGCKIHFRLSGTASILDALEAPG
jgi:hypothetical protein